MRSSSTPPPPPPPRDFFSLFVFVFFTKIKDEAKAKGIMEICNDQLYDLSREREREKKRERRTDVLRTRRSLCFYAVAAASR
jgi:hypothetical protein